MHQNVCGSRRSLYYIWSVNEGQGFGACPGLSRRWYRSAGQPVVVVVLGASVVVGAIVVVVVVVVVLLVVVLVVGAFVVVVVVA